MILGLESLDQYKASWNVSIFNARILCLRKRLHGLSWVYRRVVVLCTMLVVAGSQHHICLNEPLPVKIMLAPQPSFLVTTAFIAGHSLMILLPKHVLPLLPLHAPAAYKVRTAA